MSDKESLLARYKKNIGETRPWDLINPKTSFVETEDADKRFAICQMCPEFVSLTTQCKKCGCVMKLKTKLEKATCPLQKW